jgi:hypothetical protein
MHGMVAIIDTEVGAGKGKVRCPLWPGRTWELLEGGNNKWDVLGALNDALQSKTPPVIGGTSAGLGLLGQVVYANIPGTSVLSSEVLANPFSPGRVRLAKGFLTIPLLKDVIADSHFDPTPKHDPLGRMGRLVVFMARMMSKGSEMPEELPGNQVALGLGVDASAAVLVDAAGNARVVGAANTFAYFLTTRLNPAAFVLKDTEAPGTPLTYAPVRVYRLAPEGTLKFAADAWAGTAGATTYQVQANKGVLQTYPRAGGSTY